MPPRRWSAEWDDEAWREGDPEEGLARIDPDLPGILQRSLAHTPPRVAEIERLFRARGPEVEAIARAAAAPRARRCGDTVTYVVNRNINYTNQCYFRCGFCGFSTRAHKSLNLRGDPYILERPTRWSTAPSRPGSAGRPRSACRAASTPTSTATSTSRCSRASRPRLPEMHVHGFTPLEVWQGAHTLGISVREFLVRLRDAGLGTLPGTAAEILDDRRARPPVPRQGAHRRMGPRPQPPPPTSFGLRSTTTMMMGHIDGPRAWANHLEVLRQIQRRTGGFTEFVRSRSSTWPRRSSCRASPSRPTWDEVVLVHAVGRSPWTA